MIEAPPGSYEHVLVAVATEAVYDSGRWLDASVSPARLAVYETEQAARLTEEIEKRRGTTLSARSHQLPEGLPPPFDRFPRGRQRTFRVEPDDTIAVRTTGAWD